MKVVIDYSSAGLRLSAQAVAYLRRSRDNETELRNGLLDHCTLTSSLEAVIPPYPRSLRHHPELLELVKSLEMEWSPPPKGKRLRSDGDK